jgi:hypothetical protein
MYQCHGIRTDVVARLPSDPSPSQASSLNTVLIAEILKKRKRITVIYSQSRKLYKEARNIWSTDEYGDLEY